MTRAIVEQDYTNIAQDLLARAAKHGATASDVMVADGETLSVQVRMGAVDRLTKAREKRLGLRVFFGQRSASASTSDFSRDSLERFVGETCALAQAVVEDPVSGLPEPGQVDVVQQRREPRILVSSCNLAHTLQRTGRP